MPGLGALGVADLPSFVDLFRRQADVLGCWQSIPVGKGFRATRRNLAPFLRSVIFVGDAGLRCRFDHHVASIDPECINEALCAGQVT
jgi:hypothetical protein